MARARKITNHDEIRKWAEERGGRPACVKETGDRRGSCVLRFDFADRDPELEDIGWEEFFRIFDENHLALLEQDKTASGKISRFSKFVNR
jgi:hypothetical protein